VWFGYDPADIGNALPSVEYAPQPNWPTAALNQPTRRLFGVVTWGSGGGRQTVEVDVSEGVGVTVPTSTCEVYVYSETIFLTPNGEEVDPLLEQQDWSVMVHAAPGRAAKEARRTRQVVQPLNVPSLFLPPNDPPSRPRLAVEARSIVEAELDAAKAVELASGRELSSMERSFLSVARRMLGSAGKAVR
jgi:hypothetical protein